MLGLIADDLTGAGDASVQFARRGRKTFLSLEAEAGQDAAGYDVFAVTTDCRALSDDAAARLTCAALSRLMTAGVDRVFLKIDSTLRGSVSGQISGALTAWRTRHARASALVCPAYPLMGRTVENQRLFVHGEPVERTAFARDPISPVTTGDVSALVPAMPDVTIADARTDEDLMQIAGTIAAAGPSAIAVGSGGLAAALAARLSPAGNNEVDEAQLKLSPTMKLSPTSGRPRVGVDGRVLIVVTSMNPASHVQIDRVAAMWSDITILRAPAERIDDSSVADRVAERFAELALHERWNLFGLVGGDGARAALRSIAASGIEILDSVVEGIPVGVVAGGACDGIPVFTKAGGFGDEDALVRAIRALRS